MRNPEPPLLCRVAAFTLVELVVTMAILTALMLILVGITNSTQLAIKQQSAILDTQHAASEVFNQIERDLQRRVAVPGAQFFWEKAPGNDELAFYTQRPGYTGDRDASWVHYRLQEANAADLKKGDFVRGATGTSYSAMGIRTFTPADPLDWSNFTPIATGDYQALTRLILRLETSALVEDSNGEIVVRADPPRNADGTLNTQDPSVASDTLPDGILRGIVVTLVALDSRNLPLIDETQRDRIAAAFPDAGNGEMPREQWSKIAEGAPDLHSIAPAVLGNLRVFERSFQIAR